MSESTETVTEIGTAGWCDRQPFMFFVSRWRGHIPLGQLFWRDMLIVGTAVNVAVASLALAMFVLRLPTAAGLAVHFSPLPYNVFLYLAVWRISAGASGPCAVMAPVGAMMWLVAATLI